jgi:phospholipid/cholesterol/gamma-HCH transport system substrate-binding protein
MTRRGLEIRVGLVVVIASVILVLGVMWFQKFKLIEKRYQFYVRFDEVGGLQVNDVIYLNGVEGGQVDAVELGGGKVVVEMGVRDGLEVPVDSHVSLKSVGIMGERFVSVTLGSSPQVVASGDTIDGDFLMGLSEVMAEAGSIFSELRETSTTLREILDGFTQDGKLQSGVDNLAKASGDLRKIVAESSPKVARTIAGMERVSARLDSLVSMHYASMDSSLAGFGRTGQKMDVVAEDLGRASADLREITERLRQGQGSLGKLLADDQFIDHLNATITELDSLITDIKLRPGRYVRFELF